MKQFRLFLGVFLFGLFGSAMASEPSEVSALLKNQNSYGYQDHHWQSQEWLLDVEWNAALPKGDLTMIARLMLDGEDRLNPKTEPDSDSRLQAVKYARKHAMADLREFHWSVGDEVYWQIGKQQVVWGEADGLKLLDVINPQSFREFILDDFEDSRIPLWIIKAEVPIGDDSELQWLWIPDTTVHELAPEHSPFALRSPLQVPVVTEALPTKIVGFEAPRKPFKESDMGFRLSSFLDGWDVTLNYLYHTVDTPVVRTSFDGKGLVVEGDYERSHLIGGSASSVFDDVTIRVEWAYETDRYHRTRDPLPGVSRANQWGAVIGLDYQGWQDQFLSLQWFQTRVMGGADHLYVNKIEDRVSVIWDLKFFNETLTIRLMNLYSIDHHDGLLRPKLTYNWFSNLDVMIGVDRFYGDRDGLFGQFDDADRVTLGFEWGFD